MWLWRKLQCIRLLGMSQALTEGTLIQPTYVTGTPCVQCGAPQTHPLLCNICKRRFDLPPLSSPFHYLGLSILPNVQHHLLKKAYQNTLTLLHPCKFSRFTQEWRRQQEALVHRSMRRLNYYYGWLSAVYEYCLLYHQIEREYVTTKQRLQRLHHIDHGFYRLLSQDHYPRQWGTPWHELNDLDAHQDRNRLWRSMMSECYTYALSISSQLQALTLQTFTANFCDHIEYKLQVLYRYEHRLWTKEVVCSNRWDILNY
jgi:hypothetical protein